MLLYALLAAAGVILAVALRMFADDGPRSIEREDDPPDSSDDEDDRGRRVAA